MIREECVDCDPDGGGSLGDADVAPGGGGSASFGEGSSSGPGGLLSRALRPGGRSVSLHNLLDSSAAAAGGGGEPGTPLSPMVSLGRGGEKENASRAHSPPPHTLTPPTPHPPTQSDSIPSGALSPSDDAADPPPAQRRASGKAAPPWAGRAGVIEQLNELIDELDEMDATIALRVSWWEEEWGGGWRRGDHFH